MKPVRCLSVRSNSRLTLALATRVHLVVVSLMMGIILLLGSVASLLSLTNAKIAHNNVKAYLTPQYRVEEGVDTAASCQPQASSFWDDAEIGALVVNANNLSL